MGSDILFADYDGKVFNYLNLKITSVGVLFSSPPSSCLINNSLSCTFVASNKSFYMACW